MFCIILEERDKFVPVFSPRHLVQVVQRADNNYIERINRIQGMKFIAYVFQLYILTTG